MLSSFTNKQHLFDYIIKQYACKDIYDNILDVYSIMLKTQFLDLIRLSIVNDYGSKYNKIDYSDIKHINMMWQTWPIIGYRFTISLKVEVLVLCYSLNDFNKNLGDGVFMYRWLKRMKLWRN